MPPAGTVTSFPRCIVSNSVPWRTPRKRVGHHGYPARAGKCVDFSYMGAGAVAGAAAAQRRTANAIKAFGTVVTVEPEEFLRILSVQSEPLVATAEGGVFKTHYRYLTSYKGLAFFTKSASSLNLPEGAFVISAGSIKIPD